MRHRILGSLIVAAAVALVGSQMPGNAPSETGSAEQPIEKQQPTSTTVTKRDLVGYRLMGGVLTLPPNAQAEVYSSYNLPVEQVKVKIGDRVNRGETLVELAAGQDANLDQAKLTYDAAMAAYNQALAQYEQPVRDAQRHLDESKATERALRVSTVPGGDATELQAAMQARQAAEDTLKVAKAQASTSELPYKQQLDQAKSALDDARAGIRQSNLTAPITGTVVAVNATAGQVLDSKTSVARIVDLGAMTIRAEAKADDAAHIKKGTPVVVLFNDYPDRKFKGNVKSVNTLPAVNGGQSRLSATVDFDNTDGMIKPNASVRTVGVVIGQRNNVVAVPIDAISRDSTGKSVVKVLEGGNWKSVVVEVGMSDGYFIEISSGLSEGQTIQVVPGQGQWLLGIA